MKNSMASKQCEMLVCLPVTISVNFGWLMSLLLPGSKCLPMGVPSRGAQGNVCQGHRDPACSELCSGLRTRG